MRISFSLLLLVGLLLGPTDANAAKDYGKELNKATEILNELGSRVPDKARRDAKCVSVLTIAKGGFIIGGTGGRGFLTCKNAASGKWTAPVILGVGGGSAGAQIGGAKVELIMVFTKIGDIEDIAQTAPLFSAKASATAGPAGTGISVGGDPVVEGHVVTVSRSEGLYAGAVGEAIVVNPHEEETAELLGSSTDLDKVLVKGSVAIPASAKSFVAAVSKWHAAKSAEPAK